MNLASVVLLFLTVYLSATQLRADDFPQSYIAAQLEAAKKTVRLDLQKLEPGQLLVADYVGRPIYVYRRTAADLTYLKLGDDSVLVDPTDRHFLDAQHAAYNSSASEVWARLLLTTDHHLLKNRIRSQKDEFLVVGGWGPQSGCALNVANKEQRDSQHIIFYDSCVSISYDPAGRVFKRHFDGQPSNPNARFNLYIPPHTFASDTGLIVGVKSVESIPRLTRIFEGPEEEWDPTDRLVAAALYNDIEAAKKAIAAGADVASFRSGRASPLDAAIIGGSMELITILLKNGARPTSKSRDAAKFVGRNEVIELIDRLERK